MKKYLKILLILTVFVFCLASYMNVCYAENEITPGTPVPGSGEENPEIPQDSGDTGTLPVVNEKVKVTSVKVISPVEGVYGVGTKITIQLGFSKRIKGELPNLKIKFGPYGDHIEINAHNLAEFSNTANYDYTIKSGDNGKTSVYGFGDNVSDIYVETENGDRTQIERYLGDVDINEKVYADTTTVRGNFSNATFEWIAEQNDHRYLKLQMKNYSAVNENSYYFYISNNKNDKPNIMVDMPSTTTGWLNVGDKMQIDGDRLRQVVEKNANIYIWICEKEKNNNIPKMVIKAMEIERCSQLPLTKRIKSYFLDDKTSHFLYEPSYDPFKINVKVGLIKDTKLLNSIKNGESGSINSLLQYAKNNPAEYTGILSENEVLNSKMNIIDGAYYFVYKQRDTENGKYYPVEDIMIYQGHNKTGSSVKPCLFDPSSREFVWDVSDAPASTPTPTPTPTPNQGQSGIPQNAKKFNNHYYCIIDNELTWAEAKKYAESLGGYLVTINSKEEQDFLTKYIIEYSNEDLRFWIGGTDEEKEGVYKWVTGEKFSFANWGAKEPDNSPSTQDYIAMHNKSWDVYGIKPGQWDDIQNDNSAKKTYLICEWGTPFIDNNEQMENLPKVLPNTGVQGMIAILIIVSTAIGIYAVIKNKKYNQI